ncbi:MAG: prolipoprotein diacylglyceryl transferase [Lachnospiraceae bacterium]|nr:prolipoprotein diacylglyceryl transferase [Lachnospiraceae bacterium]
MYPYFKVFDWRIPAYGMMLVFGVILANLCAYRTCRKKRIAFWQIWVLEGYAFLGAMLGAKVLYLLVSFEQIDWSAWRDLRYVNSIMSGGFVFYGGLAAGIAACMCAGRVHHIPVLSLLSEVIYTVPLAHGFGRIGCLLAGCCYGIPYNGIFAVSYPSAQYGQAAGVTYLPVQCIETVCLWLLSLLLLWCSEKRQKSEKQPAYVMAVNGQERNGAACEPVVFYFLGYGVLRFFLEFFRGDADRGYVGALSVSQGISLVIIIASVSYVIRKKNNI